MPDAWNRKEKPLRARLIESAEIAPNVRHFLFDVPDRDAFSFAPGQWVSLSAVLEGEEITRAYSLASAPSGDNRFELCLNRVEGGRFSPFLFDLKPGDFVDVRDPMGDFVLRDPVRETVFVATGTGVAPFRSMLHARLKHAHMKHARPKQDAPPFTLLLGVRYEQDLLYRQEFETMARDDPQFRFLPTLTRPEPGWTGRAGRVQTHLTELLGERRDLDVFVCGMRAMVDDVRRILKEMGFDRKQIRYERYDV